MKIKRSALLVYAAAACLLSACATDFKIDKYSPDTDNIRLLQSKNIEADVGDFTYCENCNREALEKGITASVASCTMMIELGKKVFFSQGSEKNIKLTTVDDIDIFKALLVSKRSEWLK